MQIHMRLSSSRLLENASAEPAMSNQSATVTGDNHSRNTLLYIANMQQVLVHSSIAPGM